MPTIQVQKIATFSGHRDGVYALERAAHPHQFFSAAGDGMVVRWDRQQSDQGQLIARVPASVYALHYQPEQNWLWIGQNFDGVHVIDLHDNREIKSVKLTSAAIFSLQSWKDFLYIATGDGTIIALNAETATIRHRSKPSDKSARCLAINPIRGELAVGFSDHSIRIFDLSTLQLIRQLTGHTNSVFALKYSPDYRFLLSGGRDAHLNVWKADENYALHQSIVAHLYAINSITYSPEEQYFVTASMDKSIKVWDATTFRLLKVIDKARHAGHGTSVNCLLWTDYQQQILSGSDDRTISVWQLSQD